MTKQFLKDALGWGTLLWFIGYTLGILLFFIIPPALLGWVIMPIGTIITVWVLLKKIKGDSLKYYFYLALFWATIAIVFDYLFLVKLLKPTDSYYKFDVYLYYFLTFALPLIIGFKNKKYDHSN